MLAKLSTNPKLLPVAGAITVVCIALAVYTEKYFLAAAPLALLYGGMLLSNWRFLFWALIFCIPFSIDLGFLGLPLSTSVPDEPMMWTFLLLGIVMFAANPLRVESLWWHHPLIFIVALQFVWTIIATLYSQDILLSLKFLLAKSWFLFAFLVLPWLVFKNKQDFRRAFVLFLVPLLVTLIIILVRHWRLNFDFSLPNVAIGFLYYNRVEYSTVLSMFFPLTIIAFQLIPKERGLQRLLMLAVIILFLPAIYFTYARAAILAVLFAFGVNLAIRIRMMNWVMPVFYAAIIAVIASLVHNNKYYEYRPVFNKTYMHTSVYDHIVATFRGEDLSSMERVYRWVAGARMSQEHPLVGTGPNTFYEHYKPYAVTAFRTYVSRNPERSTTHNYFLFMLVEQGWPALILYGVLVFAFFFHVQKVYHRFNDRFYKRVTMGLAMLFAAGFVNNFFSELIETHKVGALFYFAIALLIILDRKSRQPELQIED